ncbi:MAG: rhodanese-like domain-containing protein, partial [Saprospiraceae bacterium]
VMGLMSCQSQSTPAEKAPPPTPPTESATTETATAESQTLPYQDLNVEEFRQRMAEPGIVLMDVRTPEEIANGKIEGAVELDFFGANFQEEIAKLDKDRTYLVYCRSGNRSGKTCKLMADMGFKHLFNLAGGYNAWSQQ